jgi:hypothetical protein
VGDAVEGEVLVDLVGDDDEVVFDREPGDAGPLLRVEDHAGRVVRAVQQHHLGTRRDQAGQAVEVDAEVGRAQGDGHSHAAGHLEAGDVGVVVRLEAEHLVAGVDEGQQRCGDRLGRAGRHENLARRVVLEAVEAALMVRDRIAQLGDPGAGRVLVSAGPQRVHGSVDDHGRAVGVGESLAEIDRASAHRECGHLGEDGGRDAFEPVGDLVHLRLLGRRSRRVITGIARGYSEWPA